MNQYSFTIFIVLVILGLSFSPTHSSFDGRVQTFGCTIQSLPENTLNDIKNTYDNITRYSALIENKLGESKYDADQVWQLSVQKPDKYRKTIIKINDQPLNPPVTEICNGDSFYSDETGTGRTEQYNCESLVSETFGVMDKLNTFGSSSYESNAELDGNTVRVTINLVGDKSKTDIWVNKETYLIEKVRTSTPQLVGSKTERTESYRNVVLNQDFELDEFVIPSA